MQTSAATDGRLAPGEVDALLDEESFAALSQLVRRHLGIELPPQKRPLAAERLRKLAAARGVRSVGALLQSKLHGEPDAAFLSDLADALSTNHTHFWREPKHLEILRDDALPERLTAHRHDHDLRVWCAASATGEEPWTIAMLIDKVLGADKHNWQAGLLATDVSARALSLARAGVYREENVRALPAELREKYLKRRSAEELEVAPSIRRDVLFRRFNLIRPAYPFKGTFDIVFIRNVLIYFDEPTRLAVMERIVSLLNPGGWLFIGHAETVPGRGLGLRMITAGAFRKPGQP